MIRAATTAQLRARAKKLCARFGEHAAIDCGLDEDFQSWLAAAGVGKGIDQIWIVAASAPTEHAALTKPITRLERTLRSRAKADQKALGAK